MDPKTIAIFETMSAFELRELSLLTYSTLIGQLSLLLTVMFAYFVVAFPVAKKLTVVQLVAVSFLYSGFCLIGIVGYASLIGALSDLVEFRTGKRPVTEILTTLVCVFGWLLSLLFMVQERRKPVGPAAQ